MATLLIGGYYWASDFRVVIQERCFEPKSCLVKVLRRNMGKKQINIEAKSRIDDAYRTGATELDLTSLNLVNVPESVSRLSRLTTLNISQNQISELPDWFGNLTGLRSLTAWANNFDKLPRQVEQLVELQELDFAINSIKQLPSWLSSLRELRTLDFGFNGLTKMPVDIGDFKLLDTIEFSGNRLASLPSSLGRLRRLGTLNISSNIISELPESLAKLVNLHHLNIHGNPLPTLPDYLGALRHLTVLNIARTGCSHLPESIKELKLLGRFFASGNRLSILPDWVAELENLYYLDLANNQIKALPASIGQLSLLQTLVVNNNQLSTLPRSLQKLDGLKSLYLHSNPRIDLPPEILGPTLAEVQSQDSEPVDPQAILAFYFGRKRRSAKPLNEVKVLLVGHGRVGKTSLSKALRRATHNAREPETPGIERHTVRLTSGNSKIIAHLWDFGGQEFLHQTHQFFFSQRSIYVVVLSGRQGRQMQEAEYWLRLIRTYGTNSPVVIALNQIKGHPFTVDDHFLHEAYPEVKAVVETDCEPRYGITALRQLLGKLAVAMPSVREKIDPGWASVRTHLEVMTESFVSFGQYRDICAKYGVGALSEQESLATILDCLGIALNYRADPRLRDTSVLKPRWLVDGIYTILRWLHKRKSNGEMRLRDLSLALKDKTTYPHSMHEFLLALMEKFELCFPVEAKKDSYLVPALLSENQPSRLEKFTLDHVQRIQFRYDEVRPPSLLPRFIVRSHTLSEKQPRWLRGVVLAKGKARALVRGDHEGRITEVSAIGESPTDRVWLTEFILSEMRVLNENMPVRTFVENESTRGAWTELEVLRDAARNEAKTRTERDSAGKTVEVNVNNTLQAIEHIDPNVTNQKPMPLFICYAHANEREVRRLIPSLKVLSRRGQITSWRDTDLVPGEDWDETIKVRLSQAKVVLFMVSRAFLASPYITDEERPLAMSMVHARKAIVVPVLLSACSWQSEDFATLENLPKKGELMSSFRPRETGWALVERGIESAVDRARRVIDHNSNKHLLSDARQT